jgi:hypothetical protein
MSLSKPCPGLISTESKMISSSIRLEDMLYGMCQTTTPKNVS